MGLSDLQSSRTWKNGTHGRIARMGRQHDLQVFVALGKLLPRPFPRQKTSHNSCFTSMSQGDMFNKNPATYKPYHECWKHGEAIIFTCRGRRQSGPQVLKIQSTQISQIQHISIRHNFCGMSFCCEYIVSSIQAPSSPTDVEHVRSRVWYRSR